MNLVLVISIYDILPLSFTKSITNLVNQSYFNNAVTLLVLPYKELINVITYLKYHSYSQFVKLTDLIGVDWLTYTTKFSFRFGVVYVFTSVKLNARILIVINIDGYIMIPSLYILFKNATWFEREVWDMFGLNFDNPDLRRILSDYGFNGFPLRKDFPVVGRQEVFYSDIVKRLIYKKVELVQNFRGYVFQNPWIFGKLNKTGFFIVLFGLIFNA